MSRTESGDLSAKQGAGHVARVAVIGAGTMGGGIAQAAAQAGYATRLFDSDREAAERALRAVEARLRKAVELGKLDAQSLGPTLDRLHVERDLVNAVSDADLVIEAVPEDLELKQGLFRRVAAAAPANALLASNTSSISIRKIAEAADPRRTLGLHFFNPVHLMALVEVVATLELEPAALDAAREFVTALGKQTVVVRDSPGFATSRLGIALGLEAIRMVEQGVASVEDIDRAMELGYRHPMGPLRLSDLVGLDIRLGIAENLHRELGSESFRPPELLRRLVGAGALGQKTGRGFYVWRDSKPVEPAALPADPKTAARPPLGRAKPDLRPFEHG